MMVGLLGQQGGGVHKADGGCEIRARYLANDCGAIAAPQRKVFEMFD
jgi:hypothetical protein